jgi:hypothetical protein
MDMTLPMVNLFMSLQKRSQLKVTDLMNTAGWILPKLAANW